MAWQVKNCFGITVSIRREHDLARGWIVTALLSGFTVFRTKRKRGFATGKSLPKDSTSEDINEAAREKQETETG